MPQPLKDMAGMRFGRLLVVRHDHTCSSGAVWLCRCDCGRDTLAMRGNLVRGGVTSCGCYREEHRAANAAHVARHGHAAKGRQTPTYFSWQAMNGRCRNPNTRWFYLYGGRGIKICKRWEVYENFLADMGERPPGTTLDRINPNKGYSPTNCRWATPTVQSANRRTRRARA